MAEVAERQRPHNARVLIVDDESDVQRVLRRLVTRVGDAASASTVDEACALLAGRTTWTAVVIDWRLESRFGSEVLDFARTRDALLPCALLTGAPDDRASEAAWAHGVPLFVKPLRWQVLKAFITQATEASTAIGRAVAEGVQRWRLLYGFPPASAEVFRRRIMGDQPARIVEGMAITENTYKKHVHNLLDRTGGDSIDAEVGRLLREIALGAEMKNWDPMPDASN